jgi:hypothetical protein
MQAVIVVFACKRYTVVAVCASSFDTVNLARFIAAELAEVAFVSTRGDADLFLVASELILNVATLWVATDVQFIN